MYELYSLDNKLIGKSNNVDPFPLDFSGFVSYEDGTKYWYLNGKIHRTDGPAVEFTDGYKLWYLNGKQMSKLEHNLYVDMLKLKGLT